MGIILKSELDPVFETLSLLSLYHTPDWRSKCCKDLEEYIPEPELFLEKYYNIVEKYLYVFSKNKPDLPCEKLFFQDITDDTFLLLLTMAVECRSYLDSSKPMDIMKLRSLLAYYIIDTGDRAYLPPAEEQPYLPDEKAIIEFLDTADIKSEDKWYTLDILRKPDQWLEKIMEIVRQNLSAYEKARDAVEKPLKKHLERLEKYHDPDFCKIAEAYSSNPVIYPSLASPLLQIVLYTHGYYGIFCEYINAFRASSDNQKETLIRQTKALADKSKLDILCALKVSSKYNLEIAETLGLSPSTTSHHMNALIACNFVTVEKRDGKVYYCLQNESIANYLSSLKHMLLS